MTQQQAEAPATTYPIAELERRFCAFAVDRVLTWGLSVVLGVAAWWTLGDEPLVVMGVVLGAMVLGWLVLAVMTGVSGSTPGKSAVGLRVVHHGTGTPLGIGPALLRSAVLAAASLPTFGIGLATLAWTAVEDRGRQRRGWHDHLTSSVVVDVRPVEVVTDAVDDTPRHVVNLTAMRLVPAPVLEQPVFRAPPVTRPAPEGPAFAPVQQHPVQEAPVQPPPVPHHPVRSDAASGQGTDDPGRTVVRPRRDAVPPGLPAGPRWRVIFDDGHSFVVEGLVLVGRRPEARQGEPVWHLVPLTSADMSVSKTHAQLAPAPDGALVVVDRGSTNGSTLTRQGVARRLSPGRPATLLDGDTVVFGDRSLVVRREA